MEELYRSYLSFLRSLEQGLGNLTELAEKKLDAARKDDTSHIIAGHIFDNVQQHITLNLSLQKFVVPLGTECNH